MDADEPVRIEAALERGQGLADQLATAAGMQGHVVALGLDPVDVGGGDEADAVAGTRGDPARARAERDPVADASE